MYIEVNTLFMYLCIEGAGEQKEYHLEIFQWNFYVI